MPSTQAPNLYVHTYSVSEPITDGDRLIYTVHVGATTDKVQVLLSAEVHIPWASTDDRQIDVRYLEAVAPFSIRYVETEDDEVCEISTPAGMFIAGADFLRRVEQVVREQAVEAHSRALMFYRKALDDSLTFQPRRSMIR